MADNTLKTKLKIIELNVGSLISNTKRHQMQTFLKTHKPDAVLLCETQLNEKHNIHFPNYNFIRTHRIPNSLIRGSGILLAAKYDHIKIDTRCWGLTSLECTAIQIPTDGKPLMLIAAYRNPSDNTNRTFTDDLNKIYRAHNRTSTIIIGGDLNARHRFWNNDNNCQHGEILYDWLMQNTHQPSIKLDHSFEPTFYSGNYRSFLDIFLVSETIATIYNDGTGDKLEIEDFNSSHRPVILHVETSGRPQRAPKTTFTNYAKADWKSLKQNVEQNISQVPVFNHRNMTVAEIDTAIESVATIIQNAVKTSIPQTEIRANTIIPLPQELIDLIKYKNGLRRRWHRQRFCNNAHMLKADIKNLEKIIADRIKIVYSDQWTKTLKNVKLDNNTFKHINKLTSRNRRQNIPELTVNGSHFSTDTEKAEALAQHFKTTHESTTQLGDPATTTTINNEIHSVFYKNFTPKTNFSSDSPANPTRRYNHAIHATSIENIKIIIKSRANKKSMGFDEIPNAVIKKLGDNFVAVIATLINQSANICYFPLAWKSSKIIAVQKKNKPPKEPNSYRPIALLPCLSKLFECIIKDNIMDECDELQILPDDQFGFRPRRSTAHPLVKLQKDIINNFAKKTPTTAVAIDIAKAFDTVWTEGLIHKMLNIYKFDFNTCRIIYSYLTNRSFAVNINKSMSHLHTPKAGVPQGGVLSATLYIIYVADLPHPPHHINSIKRLQYADDIFIYVSTRDLFGAKARIEQYISNVREYLHQWKLECSDEKCEAIIFKSTNRNSTPAVNRSIKKITIKIGDKILQPKKTIKYLGVMLQKDGLHSRHIDSIITKSRIAQYLLKPILRKMSGLSTKIKLLCYKQLVRPILTYAFPCWTNISSHQMERLRLAERKCLRTCLSLYRKPSNHHHYKISVLYERANIKRIDQHLVAQALKFFERNRNDDTSPIIASLQDDYTAELFETTPRLRPPDAIDTINAQGQLFNGSRLTHYHRRAFGLRTGTVYNMDQ